MKIYIVYSYEHYEGIQEILKAFYNKNDADDYINNNTNRHIELKIKEIIVE